MRPAPGIVIALLAAGVIAGGVALVIAVNADVPDPEAKAHDKVAPPPKSPSPPPPAARPTPARESSAPIPAGGFAAWTGREGTVPGEVEELARTSGVRLPVALELRRATLLEERTADPNTLGDLLGQPPTAFMLATIGTHAKLMRDASATALAANREGKLSDDDAIRATREAQQAYRAMYQRVTGLSDAQFDRMFAPAP